MNVYVYIYTYTHMYIYTNIYIYIHIYTHVHTYIYKYIYKYICVCMYMCRKAIGMAPHSKYRRSSHRNFPSPSTLALSLCLRKECSCSSCV